jgi:hypothetical protein
LTWLKVAVWCGANVFSERRSKMSADDLITAEELAGRFKMAAEGTAGPVMKRKE